MFEDKDKKFGGFEVSDTGTKFQEHRVGHSYYPGTPKIIQWVMKYSGSLVKDEKQASYVLIGFVVVAIVFTLFFIFIGRETALKYTPVPVTDREFEDVNWPPVSQ